MKRRKLQAMTTKKKTYELGGVTVDSIELKCLVIGKGIKVDNEVYRRYSKECRLGINPLMCNCFFLPDETVIQMTDIGFHLKYLSGMLSWNNLKLLRYASALRTPFCISLVDGRPALTYDHEFIVFISFPPKTDFYYRKTSSGLPYLGNAVIQGIDWVSFQCLWPCEYAAMGKPCQYCFSGADFESRSKRSLPLPNPVNTSDVAEIVEYAITSAGCNSIQITGGSTFDSDKEAAYIRGYLDAIGKRVGRSKINGDILLYITPPKEMRTIDDFFALGTNKIACSIEVWDEKRAEVITPGKMFFTTRKRYLQALEYAVSRYGAGSAISNFIIGLEPFETLKEGATYLASHGIIPTASIWMPMGRPVMNSMQTPDAQYFRKVKELFAELYQKYKLEPSACCGLNVCVERDIWKYALSR